MSENRKKILVVDDDSTTVQAMSLLLRKAGFDILVAQDGTSAMMAAQRERPDLVLLDLGLPAGNGFDVLRNLKINTRLMTTPVIVLSAQDPEQFRDRALQAGAAAYFEKPADGEALCRAVREQLHEVGEDGSG